MTHLAVQYGIEVAANLTAAAVAGLLAWTIRRRRSQRDDEEPPTTTP